jgi:hypothetical protein
VVGSVAICNPSEMLGADLHSVFVLVEDEAVRTQFLAGFRYLHFDEALNINDHVTELADSTAGIPLTDFQVADHFRTHNDFFGGQVGLRIRLLSGPWSLDLQGKTAVGATHQAINIDGATLSSVAGGTTGLGVGGLLTSPTNIGLYTRDVFTVVPEATVNLGYRFSQHFRGFVGYNFLYWSSVVRPGPQVDTTVNPTYLPGGGVATGPARPIFLGAGSDLWVQGMNLGLEFTY